MAGSQTFTLNIKALFDASDVKAKVSDIQKSFSNLKLPDNLQKSFTSSFDSLNKALTDFETRAAKGVKTKADAKGLTGSMDNVIKEFTKVQSVVDKIRTEVGSSVDLSKIIKFDKSTLDELKQLEERATKLKAEIASINTSKLKDLQTTLAKVKGEKTTTKATEALGLFKEGDITGAINLLDQLIAKQKQLEGGASNRTGTITNNIEQLTLLRQQMASAAQEVETKTQELGNITQQQANVARNAFNQTTQSIDQAANGLANYSNQAQNASAGVSNLANNQARLNTELDQVKSRIQYFLGLQNAVNLFRRAVQSAFNTVKELDAAMTETAVVTDMTVSDMWQKLPEYTERANKLGVSTLAAYKSATLYYQQGLNDDQAAALSVETLKMARIAGLDAAEATDRMTNALRGFNMELNAMSAQRVDDVYSQLAAMSASNVDEISTAMTKVASLAHNANMEFESTAAFLAQIIETTRESAETAGTALKTVVARFSEVKKLVDTNTLRGTDEEGQVVDVNKVSAALRTAGIDLNKYFLGEVGLDDIFMELASKWDSLTSVQQRYIATQAAGSRQQSRFIALMQDYARTQELVGAAYNAEGASARQFEKTQDSLESKLARLKNAWNEFLMGITNSGVIKAAVSALTTLLNIVNKITGAFGSGVGGVLKFATALATIGGLRAAFKNGGLAEKALGSLGNTGLGRFLGLGGNTNTQITSAGVAFHGEVVSAGAEFAAAVRGAAGLEAATGGASTGAGLRLTPWEALKKFKESSLDPRPVAQYQALSPAEKIRMASTGGVPGMGAAPKTLFGALGNRFYGTALGKVARGGLAKLGVAGGNAAAVSGAAALAATIGTITVAATAAAVAIKAAYDASPTGQLKMAEKYADSMGDLASGAQKAASRIRNVAESSKEYADAVNNATTVSERNKAIQSQNDYITSLLEEDATYAQYIQSTFTEGGQLYLTLDADALATAVDKIAEGANRATAHSQLAEAIVQKQTADYYAAKLAGVDLENRTRTIGEGDYASTYKLSDKEYAQYVDYQNKINAANIAMQNYATTAAARLIDSEKIGAEFSETIASAIGQTFNADEILKSARGQDWINTLFNWDRSDLEIRYKELYGGDASELKRADLIDKVAMGEALQEAVQGPIDQLTQLLTEPNAKDINTLLQSYLGQGAFTSRSMAGVDITNDAAIYQWLGVVDNLDQFEQNIRDLASALGIETGDLLNKIKKQAKDAKRQQAQNVWNTSSAMARGGVSTDNIKKFIGLDFSDQQIFQSLYDSFDAQYLTNEVTESLLQGVKSGGPEFNDWFKDLDLSNPIQAFNQLSQAATSTNVSIKSTAQALLNAGESTKQFSASNQLAFLVTTDGYNEISESLAKFKEENGEISSGNIKELAESSADLKAILDSGTMSAKALAVALEGIESGEVAVWDLNDAVIAALNSMDDLDGMVQSTIDDLNGFDPGFDENDITSFIQKAYKAIDENLQKGAIGNHQNRTYLEKIFGENIFDFGAVSVDEYGRKYEAEVQRLMGILEANQENMYSAWQSALGTYTTASGKTLEIFNKGNEVFIEGAQVTTDELVQIVAKATGLGEQWARMMVSDYKNFSPDFAYQQGLVDLGQGIQSWYDALPEIDGQKIYDQTDLSTLKNLFNVSSEDIDNAISKLDQSAGKLKDIKWTDEAGQRTADSIKSALSEVGASITGKDGLLDYDAIKQAYSDLGLPQMFESDFNTIASESTEFWASFFGNEPQRISVQQGQTAGEAYAQAYQQAVNKDLATQLSDVFKEQFAEFEIQINADTGIATIQEVDGQLTELNDKKTNPKITADNSQALSAIQSVIDRLASVQDKSVTLKTTYLEVHESIGGTAAGGVVQSYATGSANRKVNPGLSLTGEEGPEIVWNKEQGYAYVTGESHPEFQNLQPGDRVFNAQETRKILQGVATGGTVPSFAKGYGGATKKTSGGGGGGSGSGDKEKTPEEWKNELDWLYNLMEDIVELERDQKVLEEKYQDYLSDQTKTGKDLYNLLIKQLGNLYTQLNHQTFALEKREQEMREFMDTTNDKDQYLWYNWNDRTIEIDWDAIDRITDEEEYKHVKELIDEAEEIQGKMDDAEDAIMDINNQIQELENIWRDNFTDFENRVYDAIVKSYQQVIDNYSELNDTLNNSNSQILDSLQKQVSLQRQIRDNTKTEEEIADDEARLAYLRRDTSGGNDLAALQLERELAEQRESYEDTLVDQAINRLQEDNDAAAQQRQQQIDIMQAQLDYQSQNGEFNAAVRELLEGAISPDGQLLTGSDLVTLLKEQENWHAMSEVSQTVWEEELNGTFKQVVAFLLKENAEQNGTFYTALTSAVNSVSTAIGSYSQAMTKMGSEIASAASGGGGGGGGGSGGGGGPGAPSTPDGKGDYYYNSLATGQKVYSTTIDAATLKKNQALMIHYGGKVGKKYATGGLADVTGLAWLDGTPSEPEYVLNARQTDAFLKLADVLPSMMGSGAGAQTNTFGSTYITMPITLESVNPDYDVDRMVDLLKDKLYDAGSYRNVNSLSFIR